MSKITPKTKSLKAGHQLRGRAVFPSLLKSFECYVVWNGWLAFHGCVEVFSFLSWLVNIMEVLSVLFLRSRCKPCRIVIKIFYIFGWRS